MKEYKVINRKSGFTRNNERLEDQLNQHAREGWRLIQLVVNTPMIILERDKNR